MSYIYFFDLVRRVYKYICVFLSPDFPSWTKPRVVIQKKSNSMIPQNLKNWLKILKFCLIPDPGPSRTSTKTRINRNKFLGYSDLCMVALGSRGNFALKNSIKLLYILEISTSPRTYSGTLCPAETEETLQIPLKKNIGFTQL